MIAATRDGVRVLALLVVVGCGRSSSPPSPPSARPASSAAQPQRITVGAKAPPFSLPRVDGKGVASVPTGKVTLVAFWALGWGGAYALPKLEALQRRYADQGLAVVIVSHDESKDILPAMAEHHGLTAALVWDEQRKVMDRWRPDNIMSAYVIDREGVVRLVRSSGKESAPANLPSVDDKIRELLGLPRMTLVGDAGQDAPAGDVGAPVRASGPPSLRVVALMSDRAIMRAWEKDRLVIDAGVLLYGPRAGGLAVLGRLRDYALDEGGDDLVGLASRAPLRAPPARRVATHPGRVILVSRSAVGWWDVRGWDGARWSNADVDPDSISDAFFEDGFFSDGCKPVLTAEEQGAYATCPNAPLVRIVSVGVTAPIVLAGLSELRYGKPVAVARDGAIWFSSGDHLRRVGPDGRTTDLPLPLPSAELSRPHFTGEYPEQMTAVYTKDKKPGSQLRYWQSTRLSSPLPVRSPEVTKIVPLADGSVWFSADTDPRARHVVVYRYGPGEPAAIAVGTPFDQQVEIRNAAGLRPWKPSCPQAFVAAADPKRSLASWSSTVKATLDEARRRKVAAHLVEGRLGDRTVRGVLLYLTTPDADASALARATATLTTQLSGEGGGAADAFCSVPVVTSTFGER